jgi:hypothetical protein
MANDETLILSFWSGMDWKAKVPIISLIFDFKFEETYIQMSVRDSIEKRELIEGVFAPELKFDFYDKRILL